MSVESLTAALRETLELFDTDGEPLTTTEVADPLDVCRRSTYERLERLVETGYLETKKVGASARVWWRPTAQTAGSQRNSAAAFQQREAEPNTRSAPEATERRQNERAHILESELDRISDGFYVLDDQLQFRYLNGYARALFEVDNDVIGERLSEVVTVTDEFEEAISDAVEQQMPLTFEEYYDPVDEWLSSAIYPGEDGLSVYVRGVTDRKERERQLERYAGIIDGVGEPVYELDPEGRFTFVNRPFVEQLGYSEDELIGEHVSVGMDDEAIARVEAEILSLLGEGTEGTATLEYEVVTKTGERIPVENRISLVTDDGTISGSAGVIHDITDRKRRERELERQREQVTALNHLNETVREVTDAVIEESTRNEIEQAACEGLVNSDSYAFAWIADVDLQSQRIQPRIEVGVDGYLDEIDLSADPDEAVGRGPAGRAVRTGEMQVSTNVFEDETFEPWREYARQYGYSAFAAIPITHESTTFGLLGVYSEREGAFEAPERSVVGQLGEIIGHAIAAADRKQALMSDEVVELRFRIRNIFEVFALDVPTAGRIVIEHTIPVGDDEFLHYGAATPDAIETLESLVDALPQWREVRFWGDDEERAFELRVSSPPMLSKVAAIGGSVESAVIEDGDYYTTIHVAPSADVRQLIETFREHYSNSELMKRQQITRRDRPPELNSLDVESQLTDSQRKALETAVYSGFFEWPREVSGQEVADSLDIAPSTFSQHLRKAQKNVFSSLFLQLSEEAGTGSQ